MIFSSKFDFPNSGILLEAIIRIHAERKEIKHIYIYRMQLEIQHPDTVLIAVPAVLLCSAWMKEQLRWMKYIPVNGRINKRKLNRLSVGVVSRSLQTFSRFTGGVNLLGFISRNPNVCIQTVPIVPIYSSEQSGWPWRCCQGEWRPALDALCIDHNIMDN